MFHKYPSLGLHEKPYFDVRRAALTFRGIKFIRVSSTADKINNKAILQKSAFRVSLASVTIRYLVYTCRPLK